VSDEETRKQGEAIASQIAADIASIRRVAIINGEDREAAAITVGDLVSG
jgi:hypothetical protein